MKLIIDIPKEFEECYKSDKFIDSLNRVAADIHPEFNSDKIMMSGKYEWEFILMLREVFERAIIHKGSEYDVE